MPDNSKQAENLNHLKNAIESIDESFVHIRKTDFDIGTKETLSLIFESIGSLRSNLMLMLIDLNKGKLR